MDEFALIRRHFAGLSPAGAPGVRLGIGDDAALLAPPPGEVLAMTSDTLVAGRHFPVSTPAFDIGWKALAVNLSDLAAMAATPRWYLLALTLPAPDDDWLAGFAAGLRALADAHGVALVGGDTTRGPLSITITAVGSVPAASALRRDGAQIGDLVAVTGTLGDAALGLALTGQAASVEARGACAQTAHDHAALRLRLDRPTPRLAAGVALRGLASAAIDLSDGLAGDLGHILAASGVGATLAADRLPMSEPFARQADNGRRLALQASGGDDYELCVTIPPARWDAAVAAVAATGTTLAPVGLIEADPGLRWRRRNAPIDGPAQGYRHFGGTAVDG